MGAPVTGIKQADDSSAEALFSAFDDISAAERRRHATVYNYWLSIRGDRHFPPIRDLDPLEISDAGPSSALLELIGGGEDAEIRHLGQAIKDGPKVERISEAPRPSLLSCIARQLPVIANARQALAFQDEFATSEGSARCWVTLLPFSSSGTYVDYVYGFVSLRSEAQTAEKLLEVVPDEVEVASELVSEGEEALQMVPDQIAETAAEGTSAELVASEFEAPVEVTVEDHEMMEGEPLAELEAELPDAFEAEPVPPREKRPGFSKLFDTLAGVSGFYGNVIQMDPKLPSSPEEAPLTDEEPEPQTTLEEHSELAELVADETEQQFAEAQEQLEEPDRVPEGFMQTRLAEVRSKADEARMAKLRANAALYEGLGAAYDFALDAEENAEEYLKLVEGQGLKIQLRSPMKPVVKLAFDGLCDEATIAQLETVLAWALKQDLPRGSLAERIEAEGGLGAILSGQAGSA